jgi:hypothetical protein
MKFDSDNQIKTSAKSRGFYLIENDYYFYAKKSIIGTIFSVL